MNCRVCGAEDPFKPQIFRGEDWCCDRHRKVITGELEPTYQEVKTMEQSLYDELGGLAGNE